jgi:hypothetical protein
MGISATQEMVFESEEQRSKAINDLPELPENEDKIDSIMKAPIKAKVEGEAASKPADQKPAVEIKSAETPDSKTPPVVGADETFTIKKSDLLAKGFDTPGKFMKTWDESQELIKRQNKFIQDKLTNTPQDQVAKEVLERAERAERELSELKKKSSAAPAAPATVTQGQISTSQSKLAEIQKLKDELGSSDTFDEKTAEKRKQLDNLWFEELTRLNGLVSQQVQETQSIRDIAVKSTQEVETYKKNQETQRLNDESQKALVKELESIDKFCNNPTYVEFKMSKPSIQVEGDYLMWGKNVASLYYGQDVDVNSREGRVAMKTALDMLGKGAPDITEKCRVAGVPVTPCDDIRKYLDICDLLDYRDGLRANPVTGKKETVQRYHPPSRSYIPDAFPSIESAYENRKITDGFYAQKISDQYRKGGADALAAVAKRDSGIVELDNVTTSKGGAGAEMTKEKALETINSIDEERAVKMKRDGKPELFDQLAAAYKVIGVDLDGI